MDSLGQLSTQSLARLFTLEERVSEWSDAELGDILRHQLDTPLVIDLGEAVPTDNSQPLQSFREVLLATAPPRELLVLVKSFSKRMLDEHRGSLPHDVALVLYYVTISKARACRYEPISQLQDNDWSSALRWALGRSWLDTDCRELLRVSDPNP